MCAFSNKICNFFFVILMLSFWVNLKLKHKMCVTSVFHDPFFCFPVTSHLTDMWEKSQHLDFEKRQTTKLGENLSFEISSKKGLTDFPRKNPNTSINFHLNLMCRKWERRRYNKIKTILAEFYYLHQTHVIPIKNFSLTFLSLIYWD